MKCVVCHGVDIGQVEVHEEISVGQDIVRVPVSVLACLTCGERYYDRRTVRFLEEVERDVKDNPERLPQVGRVLLYH
jgi:YgiT-type zinc finger domain-containing protein